MEGGATRDGALFGLGTLVVLCAAWTIAVGSAPAPRPSRSTGTVPVFVPANAFVAEGTAITIRSTSGGSLWWSDKDGGVVPQRTGDEVTVRAVQDQRNAVRTMTTPTAMQWRHPLPGLPTALVLRAAEVDDLDRPGRWSMHTCVFTDHGRMPIVSISAPDGALFGADSGIYVVGDAILQPEDEVANSYARDPKWWKYPGNFHGRGKEWEREARMQLIDPQGEEVFQAPVRLRVNGQMTRGFPQHALRLEFDEPLHVPLFANGDGAGTTSMVLRTAGNDQVKAMMRDAYQHGLCVGLPFEVSQALPSVVYINGAYWGVHHLRQRIDDQELARRHGIPFKDITILEDRAQLYRGDQREVANFLHVVHGTEHWNAKDPAWIDSLEKSIDLDGYLVYMASQMILGNKDWPSQNVKYWRFTGWEKGNGYRDGRWYFIMGDSDLGFGAIAPASADMFADVRPGSAPISRLFMAMMRSPLLRDRFLAHARSLLNGPLSPERCTSALESFVALLTPEMERHTARWRKPLDEGAWLAEVQVMRVFARDRGPQVLEQLKAFNGQ
ncbi:MAG: CotH kinase family protein [Flavobacteriales bacterium]